MKNKILFVFLFFVFFAFPSYALWVDSNVGTSEMFGSISFLDHYNGYVSGAHGALYKTADGGLNWEQIETGTSDSISKVFSKGANRAFFINASNSIMYEYNLGTVSQIKEFSDFRNAYSFFSLGSNLYTVGRGGTYNFSRSLNEGVSWGDDQLISASTIEAFSCVSFADSQKGWIGGARTVNDPLNLYRPVIYRTTNGGISWEITYLGLVMQMDGFYVTDIYALDDNNVYVSIPDGRLRMSSDGGLSWKEVSINIQDPNAYVMGVKFFNNLVGWTASFSTVSTEGSGIYRTLDGGFSWRQVKGGNYFSMEIIKNPTKIIAVGLSGAVTILLPPDISGVSKGVFGQGTRESISVYGTGFETGEAFGNTVLPSIRFNKNGVTLESLRVVSSTEITGVLDISSDAELGMVEMTLENIDSTTTVESNVFEIGAGASGMTISTTEAVVPSTGIPGESINVGINGENIPNPGTTGTIEVALGSGIIVRNIKWISGKQITANISIEVGSVPGARTLSVTVKGTSGEVVASASKGSAFVIEPVPSPDSMPTDIMFKKDAAFNGASWNPDKGPATIIADVKEAGDYNIMLVGQGRINYKTSKYLQLGRNRILIPGTPGTNTGIQALESSGSGRDLSNSVQMIVFERNGKISKAKIAIFR